MRIAYVVGSEKEPSERFIDREVAALQALGAEVIIYSIARKEGFVCPWCALGKHVWLSVLPRTWRAVSVFPFGELAALRPRAWREFVGGLDLATSYARDMRAKGVEHVHAHFLTKPAAVGMMAAAILRVPFTVSAHARDVFAAGTALRQKVAAAECVAVCNRAAFETLKERLPDRLHGRLALVRHGLDAAELEFRAVRDSHSPARLLAAGRLVEKKGFGQLVAAMKELDGCLCEIAGSGPLEASLREQVNDLGLGGRVAFAGWLAPGQLHARMMESDLLVAPSVIARDGDRDGVPNVLLEAAAIGLPIIAADAGGVGEFVRDGETGRLVPPDDPHALAESVRAALADPEATRRLARNARKKVEIEYNLRDNTRLLMDLFTRPRQGRV